MGELLPGWPLHKLNPMEKVHSVWDFYDGPRTGIADYNGSPHYFACTWDVVSDDYGESYSLSPIDAETLALALEQQDLWRKWEDAFHAGTVTSETHPGLGGRDARYDELQNLVQSRLNALPPPRIHACASFQQDPAAEGLHVGDMRPLLVRWSSIA